MEMLANATTNIASASVKHPLELAKHASITLQLSIRFKRFQAHPQLNISFKHP